MRLGLPKPAVVVREALLMMDRLAPGAGVPVLCYHKICDGAAAQRHPLALTPGAFTAQMEFLAAEGYRTVPAGDVLAPTSRGDRVLALTFDDGHADALEIAAPVLERFGFTAAVFPVTDWIGTTGWLDNRTGGRLDVQQGPDDLASRFLTWEELRALQAMGWTVGSHTCTHAALVDIGPEARRWELEQSRRLLEGGLGTTVELLAYPYRSCGPGPAADALAAGYRLAFSLEPGLNAPGSDPMSVRRAAVRGWNDLRDVQLRLTSRYTVFRRVAGAVERRAEPAASSEGAGKTALVRESP